MARITYDPAKDLSNQVKHGLSLALAAGLEWETLECQPDMRRDYAQTRQIGYAIAGDRLYCGVFVDRPEVHLPSSAS